MEWLSQAWPVVAIIGLIWMFNKAMRERREATERFNAAYRDLQNSSDRRVELINREYKRMNVSVLATARALWCDGEISDKAMDKIKDVLGRKKEDE